jgi:hypothetical protein
MLRPYLSMQHDASTQEKSRCEFRHCLERIIHGKPGGKKKDPCERCEKARRCRYMHQILPARTMYSSSIMHHRPSRGNRFLVFMRFTVHFDCR